MLGKRTANDLVHIGLLLKEVKSTTECPLEGQVIGMIRTTDVLRSAEATYGTTLLLTISLPMISFHGVAVCLIRHELTTRRKILSLYLKICGIPQIFDKF
jgi:hypothetical protein